LAFCGDGRPVRGDWATGPEIYGGGAGWKKLNFFLNSSYRSAQCRVLAILTGQGTLIAGRSRAGPGVPAFWTKNKRPDSLPGMEAGGGRFRFCMKRERELDGF